jgi:hypothetical protein
MWAGETNVVVELPGTADRARSVIVPLQYVPQRTRRDSQEVDRSTGSGLTAGFVRAIGELDDGVRSALFLNVLVAVSLLLATFIPVSRCFSHPTLGSPDAEKGDRIVPFRHARISHLEECLIDGHRVTPVRR